MPRRGSQPFQSPYPAAPSAGKGQLCFHRRRPELDWLQKQLVWREPMERRLILTWQLNPAVWAPLTICGHLFLLSLCLPPLFTALMRLLFNMHTKCTGTLAQRRPSAVRWISGAITLDSPPTVVIFVWFLGKSFILNRWKEIRKERKEGWCELRPCSGRGWWAFGWYWHFTTEEIHTAVIKGF